MRIHDILQLNEYYQIFVTSKVQKEISFLRTFFTKLDHLLIFLGQFWNFDTYLETQQPHPL